MIRRALASLAWAAAAGSAVAAPFAWITNQGSHDVSVIDLATQKVIATTKVGRSPAGVVAASRAGKVFVSNPDSKTISVLDMRTNAVVGTLPAGDGPLGIDATPDGRRLLVADWYAGRLLVFDTTKPDAPPRSIALGRAPAGVAAHADNRTAFVAERDDDSVAAVDLDTLTVRGRAKVGERPFALTFDPQRERVYALNVGSDDVTVLDAKTLRPVGRVAVGKAPYGAALAHGGKLLYVTNQHADTVSVIDADTLAVQRTLTGFGYPEGIAAHGDRVYVVNWMDDKVSVLDAATGRALGEIATGSNSRGFGAFIGDAASASPASHDDTQKGTR